MGKKEHNFLLKNTLMGKRRNINLAEVVSVGQISQGKVCYLQGPEYVYHSLVFWYSSKTSTFRDLARFLSNSESMPN